MGIKPGQSIRWTKSDRETLVEVLRGEIEPPPEIDAALNPHIRRRAAKKKEAEVVVDSMEEEDDHEGTEYHKEKEEVNSAEAENVQKVFKIFDSHFIELVKLIPSVPKKGELDVSAIKRSQYFFS